jgi:GNAT superfamily N-acetyltransferase
VAVTAALADVGCSAFRNAEGGLAGSHRVTTLLLPGSGRTGALLEEPIAGPAEIAAFAALHRPALEVHEARHNMILGRLEAAETSGPLPLRLWTLGGSGQCAVQVTRRHIVLGDLDRDQCGALASMASETDYAGVVGPENTARWFAESAMKRGERFAEPLPQTILALDGDPRFPATPGVPRPAAVEDVSLLHDWLLAFCHEAVPHDPLPVRQDVEREVATGRYLFWTVEGEPVALAGQARQTRNATVIAPVYTPPFLRGRGYGGSAAAAIIVRGRTQGKSLACVYVDARNPYANRCYARIGFKPICPSSYYPRIRCVV